MKRRLKAICGISLSAVMLFSAVPTFAMTRGSGGIQYYADLVDNDRGVSAGVSTEDILYPTSYAKIWYTGSRTNDGTGVSYATYSQVKINTGNSNYFITDNQVHLTAGSGFNYWTKAN